MEAFSSVALRSFPFGRSSFATGGAAVVVGGGGGVVVVVPAVVDVDSLITVVDVMDDVVVFKEGCGCSEVDMGGGCCCIAVHTGGYMGEPQYCCIGCGYGGIM